MTTLAVGSSVTVLPRDDGMVAIATNGGFGSVAVTPTGGAATTTNFGPAPIRQVFGPYSEGAVVTITNNSCNSLDYDGKQVLSDSADPVSRVTNLTGLNRWKLALAGAERSPARIYVTGNSVFDGAGVDGTTTPSDADMDAFSAAGTLRSMLARDFGAPKAGAIPAADTRWATTGTCPATINNTVAGPGGGKFRVMSSGATLTVTLPACTSIELWYYGGAGLGAFTYSIDGGGAVAVNTATVSPANYASVTLSGLSAATHTVVITATANNTYFGGAIYHSGTGVIVGKWARSSWGLKDVYGTGVLSSGATAGGQARAKQGFAMGSPHLVTIGYVRNDWKGHGNTGYTPNLYVADLEEIYGYVTAAGGCILVTGEPDDQHSNDAIGATYGPYTYAQFHEAARNWAASKQHAAFMSVADMWGSWEKGQANGLYRASNDEIHAGIAGNPDIGRMMYAVLARYRAY